MAHCVCDVLYVYSGKFLRVPIFVVFTDYRLTCEISSVVQYILMVMSARIHKKIKHEK